MARTLSGTAGLLRALAWAAVAILAACSEADAPQSFAVWGVPIADAEGAAWGVVQKIRVGRDGSLWFATSRGVHRLDPGSGLWRTYTTLDGLASDYVITIHEDSTGALWFGTSGGVSRYEPPTGRWRTFTTRDGLTSDVVGLIHEDTRGALWFGAGVFLSADGGVSRYEPRTGAWRTFTTRDGLASGGVTVIHEDSRGALWFGTSRDGVSRYEPRTGAWRTFTTRDGLASGGVTVIREDSRGALWFGLGFAGVGVSRYEPASGAWRTFSEHDGLASNDVLAIYEDARGALWVAPGDCDAGVSRYEPATGAWRTFTTRDGLAEACHPAFHEDAHGALWLGSSRYEPASGTWHTFSERDGFIGGTVFAIQEDAVHVLWFGSRRGVSRYDPATGAWRTFTTRDGLAGHEVSAIHRDARGALWFGTSNDGVTRYDPATGAWRTFTTRDGLAGDGAHAIREDAHGALWFAGGGDGGVSRYEPRTGAWSAFRTRDGLANDFNNVIHEDRSGALWFAGGGGVSRYEPATGAWRTFTTRDGLASDDVSVIHEDAHGALWFGAALGSLGGVSRYEPGTGTWRTFTTRDGLADNAVTAIHADAGHALWFATMRGVSRYEPATGAWRTFTTRDGLANDFVAVIYEDQRGALWFGTGRSGVSRYEPATGAWRTFTTRDGLASDGVTVIYEDAAHALWFGSGLRGRGVSRYEPARGTWRTLTVHDGLANDSVSVIREDATHALWFGTPGGASRIDSRSGRWLTLRDGQIFPDSSDGVPAPVAVQAPPDASTADASADSAPAISLVNNTPTSSTARSTSMQDGWRARLSLNPSDLLLLRPWSAFRYPIAGTRARRDLIEPFPNSLVLPTSLAQGPGDCRWIGTLLSGLGLHCASREPRYFTRNDGLPDMSIGEISPVPGSGNRRIWVAFEHGAALLAWTPHAAPTSRGSLRVQQRVGFDDSTNPITPGEATPVDHVEALPDGSAFLAYNAMASNRFLNPEIAWARARTYLRRVDANGRTVWQDDFANGEVRALRHDAARNCLWAATSSGLWSLDSATSPNPHWRRVVPSGRQVWPPLSTVLLDPTGVVWVATERQRDVPAFVIGYDPASDTAVDFAQGLPALGRIDDLAWLPGPDERFSFGAARGELVVLSGTQLVRGRLRVAPLIPWWTYPAAAFVSAVLLAAVLLVAWVFFNAQVRSLRGTPTLLAALPLTEFPVAFRRLGRAGALRALWQRLGLPAARLEAVRRSIENRLTPDARLQLVGGLLGRIKATPARKAGWPDFPAVVLDLASPESFKSHDVVAVSLCRESMTETEPKDLARALTELLESAHSNPALPFLCCTDAPEDVRQILPARPAALVLDDHLLRTLVLAARPEYVLTGLLLTRHLLHVNPYDSSGDVRSEMFYGRAALLAELARSDYGGRLLVGPRRVGKSSLLRRVEQDIKDKRSDIDPVYLSLLNVRDYDRASQALRSATKLPTQEGVANTPAAFVESLEEYLRSRTGRCLLIIDESDALLESDGGNGFPLLGALRNIAERKRCSFIFAGYWYLFRTTLEYNSPMFNFAEVRRLGPLTSDEGFELATEPMARLGIRYDSDDVPRALAHRTGCYPSILQKVAGELLNTVAVEDNLTLRLDHLNRACKAIEVVHHLEYLVTQNTDAITQIALWNLVEHDNFDEQRLSELLSSATKRRVERATLDAVVVQLELFGIIVRANGRKLTWAIPLLRDVIREVWGTNFIDELAAKLDDDQSRWIRRPAPRPGPGE